MQFRNITLGRAADGEDSIPAVLATDAPVRRGGYLEQLDCTPGGCDLSRSPLPLLIQHDAKQLAIGVAEEVQATGRKVRAKIRFGASPLAQEVKRDVLAGIHRSLSVAYELLDEGRKVAADTWKFRWAPYETSIVSVPADAGAGFFRHRHKDKAIMEIQDTTGAPGDFDDAQPRLSRSQRRAAQAAAIAAETELTRGVALERKRVGDIRALGNQFRAFGGDALADDAIEAGTDWDTFRERLLSRVQERQTPVDAFPPAPVAPGTFAGPPLPAYGAGARAQIRASSTRVAFQGEAGLRDGYAVQQWIRGAMLGRPDAVRWLRDHGDPSMTRALGGGSYGAGGLLIPDQLQNEVLRLEEQFGIARRICRTLPMNSDSLRVPMKADGPTAAFVAENATINPSDPSWQTALLSAKKVASLVKFSSELAEDSGIDLASYLAEQLARAFAELEDACMISGDGTSTYGGMMGVLNRLAAGSKVQAATDHDTFTEIDSADVAKLIARLPQYAVQNARFLVSPVAFGEVFGRLVLTAGGNDVQSLATAQQQKFLGFPVEISSKMPNGSGTDYSNAPMIAFGDFSQGVLFGARRNIEVQLLTETFAAQDQLAIRATSRFDVVVVGPGTATAAGPIVLLTGH